VIRWLVFSVLNGVCRIADRWAARYPEAARRARERFYAKAGPGSPRGYGVGRY
jgi:hypothetical protein